MPAGDLDLSSLRDAINSKTAATGVTAKMGDTNSSIVLTDASGGNISFDDYEHTATTTGITLSVDPDGDGPIDTPVDTAFDVTETSVVTGQVSFTSTKSFAVNAEDVADSFFDTTAATSFTSELDSVADIDLSTAENAAKAIEVIDVALQKISQSRGDLGAVSNRLDSTISNLTNISVSTQAAKSQIVDADFAQESTNLARGQILSQAATAMLAQANSSKQNVMSLLRG
jgi:flagellin